MQIMSKFSSVQFSASVACLYWHILWDLVALTDVSSYILPIITERLYDLTYLLYLAIKKNLSSKYK